MPFGGVELLVILAIILLFFGAKRLPQLGRSLGRSKQEFHKAVVEDDSDKGDELREGKDKEELSSSRREETRS